MKKKTANILSLVFLIVSFLLCRYAFFAIHGMKQWPLLLFILAVVITAASMLKKSRFIPYFSSLGYLVSFFIGVFFEKDSWNPEIGTINNLWIIWIISYFIFVFIGLFLEIFKTNKKQ